MARFEEVQMLLAESAKEHLELFNMQVFIEQFTLDRESRLSLSLYELDPPFPVSATVSFTYDAFQTGATLYDDAPDHEHSTDVDTSVEIEFSVHLPIMVGSPDIQALADELKEAYPDVDPVLIKKDIVSQEGVIREYELGYSYTIEAVDILDKELVSEIFEELKGVLDTVNRRTKKYIDKSWYRSEGDSFK